MKSWKVQKFGGDLLYDLRSRGLLPLAIVLVIGIVAAPMVISRTGGSSDAEPTGNAKLQSAADLAPEGQSAVLAYTPGLRNYRERLDQLSSKDPFIQQFTTDETEKTLESTAGGASQDAPVGGTGESGSGGSGGTGGSGGGGGGGGNGGSGGGKNKTFYTHYEVDLMVGVSGQTLTRRNRVQEFTILPSTEVPAAVFLGASADGKQAIFSVSRSVTSVSGTGICYPEPDSCELLGLARGQGADLAYQGSTYRIEAAQIKKITSTKPPN